MSVKRSPTRKTITPVAATRLQTALGLAPQSLEDLVAVSGLSKPTVTRYVKELCEAKMAHVSGWARDARDYPTIRQFSAGFKPDVPVPLTTRTAADRMRNLRIARKAGAQ